MVAPFCFSPLPLMGHLVGWGEDVKEGPMADNDTPDDKTVTLKPGKPAAKPKLAPVSTGPKSVVVSVPTAVPTAVPVASPTAPAGKSDVTKPKVTVAVTDDGPVKKGALLDQVVERSGIKRADAKAVMDALFAVMGDELLAENDLQLPPMGKLKVVKSKDVGRGAKAITLKLRTPNTQS